MDKPSYLAARVERKAYSWDETGKAKDFTRTIIQAAPVFDEWIETLNEDEKYNAASDVFLALCVTPDYVCSESSEARERRRRNKPRAKKALMHIAKAKEFLGLIENSIDELINELDIIENHLERIFIEKGNRFQKSNWQDWARFFHDSLKSMQYRKTPYSKPLELTESDWVLIIQAAIGDHVSRDAVKNWLNREDITLKF